MTPGAVVVVPIVAVRQPPFRWSVRWQSHRHSEVMAAR